MENMKKSQLCIKATDEESARKILRMLAECTNLEDIISDGDAVEKNIIFDCDDGTVKEKNIFKVDEDDLFDKTNEIYDMLAESSEQIDDVFEAVDDIEATYVQDDGSAFEDAVVDALYSIEQLQDRLCRLSDKISILPKRSEDGRWRWLNKH